MTLNTMTECNGQPHIRRRLPRSESEGEAMACPGCGEVNLLWCERKETCARCCWDTEQNGQDRIVNGDTIKLKQQQQTEEVTDEH